MKMPEWITRAEAEKLVGDDYLLRYQVFTRLIPASNSRRDKARLYNAADLRMLMEMAKAKREIKEATDGYRPKTAR